MAEDDPSIISWLSVDCYLPPVRFPILSGVNSRRTPTAATPLLAPLRIIPRMLARGGPRESLINAKENHVGREGNWHCTSETTVSGHYAMSVNEAGALTVLTLPKQLIQPFPGVPPIFLSPRESIIYHKKVIFLEIRLSGIDNYIVCAGAITAILGATALKNVNIALYILKPREFFTRRRRLSVISSSDFRNSPRIFPLFQNRVHFHSPLI